MNRFIHDNFFNGPEQLAFVYDPVHHEQGLFVWRGGVPIVEPFVAEVDVPPRTSTSAEACRLRSCLGRILPLLPTREPDSPIYWCESNGSNAVKKYFSAASC